jgi:hypothetical protein
MQMKIERQAHSAIDIVQTEGKGLFWVRRRCFPGQAHQIIDGLGIFDIDRLAVLGQANLVLYSALYQLLGIEGRLHRHPLLFHVASIVPLLLLSVCKHKQQHSAATYVVRIKCDQSRQESIARLFYQKEAAVIIPYAISK